MLGPLALASLLLKKQYHEHPSVRLGRYEVLKMDSRGMFKTVVHGRYSMDRVMTDLFASMGHACTVKGNGNGFGFSWFKMARGTWTPRHTANLCVYVGRG